MAKSNRTTVLHRVQEIYQLLLAGAEFADIRQYASERNWNVSERQIQRYIERAYQRFEQQSHRNRKQLWGRHLMQRRAIYARCMKSGDLRTALHVLKDEASLQGIYPETKISATTTTTINHQFQPYSPPVTREDRVERALQEIRADARGDELERSHLERSAPIRLWKVPDTFFVIHMLQLLTMQHVIEQLERIVMCQLGSNQVPDDPDTDDDWQFMKEMGAYLFCAGREGWKSFTEELDIDGDLLVRANYPGRMLQILAPALEQMAPEPEVLRERMAEQGQDQSGFVTAEGEARKWRREFENATGA
jgi:hypothetical protein